MRHTTFRFALDPTPVQEEMLARHAGTSRFAYNQCLRFVTDALTRKRLDPSVNVPWSGYDLINAFNTWKKSENAGRVFIVSPDGTVAAGSDGTEVGRWPANDPLSAGFDDYGVVRAPCHELDMDPASASSPPDGLHANMPT